MAPEGAPSTYRKFIANSAGAVFDRENGNANGTALDFPGWTAHSLNLGTLAPGGGVGRIAVISLPWADSGVFRNLGRTTASVGDAFHLGLWLNDEFLVDGGLSDYEQITVHHLGLGLAPGVSGNAVEHFFNATLVARPPLPVPPPPPPTPPPTLPPPPPTATLSGAPPGVTEAAPAPAEGDGEGDDGSLSPLAQGLLITLVITLCLLTAAFYGWIRLKTRDPPSARPNITSLHSTSYAGEGEGESRRSVHQSRRASRRSARDRDRRHCAR